jgi:hypothetical protein
MIPYSDLHVETLFLLALAVFAVQLLSRLKSRTNLINPISAADYLYKIARITGASEYDIFCKSAEDWPVSGSMVEEHFKECLRHQVTPYYVNAFLRKHKNQIDQLRLPPV